MKRTVVFLLLLATLSAFSQPKHEVRAVWLTVLGNLDWPTGSTLDGEDATAQQQELVNILDRLKAINVNTVLLHTRIRANTIYPSNIEPWAPYLSGRPGRDPGYDALQFAIDECHKRGMELHAWVVTIPIGKLKSHGCQQLRQRYPSLVKHIGEEGYLNPEDSRTADYLTDICEEITRRYDIDGIHLDYIRYPETWKGRKNPDNITRIVRSIHDRVKYYKPWIKLSCSPIGKYDDLSRFRSNGWNARSRVGQDAQEWLHNGLMDQLYPMMYFAGNNFYPFAIDWKEYDYGRQVVSGLGVYMLHPRERNWSLDEIKRQLNVTRQIGMGHCYFRAKFLLDNVKGVYDYAALHDRYPALVPPMTWASTNVPEAPQQLQVERAAQGDKLNWSGAYDRSNGPYLLYNIYASEQYPVDITKAENLLATRFLWTHTSIQRTNDKARLYYAVTAVDRYGNESSAKQEESASGNMTSVNSFLANDGRTLKTGLETNGSQLLICTLQGQVVRTTDCQQQINIAALPDGMYELKNIIRKKTTRRVGFFMVKK